MPATSFRLVVDTNVLLAGLASESSASQKVVDALRERRAIPLLSPSVLSEYRAVLTHPAILNRFPYLTPRRVAVALSRLSYIGEEFGISRVRFALPRDPTDAMFIELAIVGNATHLVTLDHDLLSLATSSTDTSRRLHQRSPKLRIVRPADLLRDYADLLAST